MGMSWSSRRKGVDLPMAHLSGEVVGVIAVLILINLIVVWFFLSGAGSGCNSFEGCEKAREELRQLVADVNAACEQSANTLQLEATELGEYNFYTADELYITQPYTFLLVKYKGNRDLTEEQKKQVREGRSRVQQLTQDWEVEMTAEQCTTVNACGIIGDVTGDCHNSGASWVFKLYGGSTGTVHHTTQEQREINLKYVGDKAGQLPGTGAGIGDIPDTGCWMLAYEAGGWPEGGNREYLSGDIQRLADNDGPCGAKSAGPGDWDNCISSFKIKPGCYVEAYSAPNFETGSDATSGKKRVRQFTSNTSQLSDVEDNAPGLGSGCNGNWNDCISSLKIGEAGGT